MFSPLVVLLEQLHINLPKKTPLDGLELTFAPKRTLPESQ